MQFGGQAGHSKGDLGKYGVGFKLASLSQGRRLTLLTRAGSFVAGRRWTRESVAEGWYCELIDDGDAADELDRNWPEVAPSAHGTVIQWDHLDHLSLPAGALMSSLKRLRGRISAHLGTVFHRFLDPEFAGSPVRIFIPRLIAAPVSSGHDPSQQGSKLPRPAAQ